MARINVMALFCEDVREEKGDTVSLIGVLPDHVILVDPEGSSESAAGSNKILMKLAVYIRMNFDPNTDPGEAEVRLSTPDDDFIPLGRFSAELIAKARTESKERGNALSGVIMRVGLGGLKITKPGLLRAEVTVGGETFLAGAINFRPSPGNATRTSA